MEWNAGVSIQQFLGDHLCTPKTTCPSDLGCGNLRSWCEVKAPFASNEFGSGSSLFELHFVDAPTVNDGMIAGQQGVDAWIECVM